jgi:hypothetical protein
VALGDLQEEPSAGKPHARICEGESRMAELLDHPPNADILLLIDSRYPAPVPMANDEMILPVEHDVNNRSE